MQPIVALLDNGSIRAESTVELRRSAILLARKIKEEVIAVSLDHSHRADLSELDGIRPTLLDDFLSRDDIRAGRPAIVQPFFLGNRGAIASRMEKTLANFANKNPKTKVKQAKYLFEEDGDDQAVLAKALAAQSEQVIAGFKKKPRVILVDHGSPVPMAAQVRNFVAGQLQSLLNDKVLSVTPASMERREGKAYAFTDPLLEDVLRRPKFQYQPVVLAMFFLLPGKHAGPGGDVAEICEQAKEECPGLEIYQTDLLAQHPLIIDTLAKRYHNAV